MQHMLRALLSLRTLTNNAAEINKAEPSHDQEL
jgi:hypothetical protein